MRSLTFAIESAEAVPFAAAPAIAFKLRVANSTSDEDIQSVALRCQIQIEAARRRYSSGEREELVDLFGDPDRWSQTLRSLLWAHTGITVPAFSSGTVVDLPVPCTFDFNVAATKYFHAIQDGDLPLCFQFSGTIFYPNPDGALQITQINWDKETKFRLPAKVWHDMMDLYYPNSAWLRLRRDVFERLYEYKRQQGLATWEQALENLLQLEKEAVS
jgi:hypothetical protein